MVSVLVKRPPLLPLPLPLCKYRLARPEPSSMGKCYVGLPLRSSLLRTRQINQRVSGRALLVMAQSNNIFSSRLSVAVSTPTTVVVIVVPVVVVIISWCGCCCCCGCWCWSSKFKSTVEVEKKEDKAADAVAYTIQNPRSVPNNSFSIVDFRQNPDLLRREITNMNAGSHSKNASQQTNRSSFLSTVHSLDVDGKSTQTDSSSKSWRKYPRWVDSVTPPSSAQRSRITGVSVHTMTRSERSLPLKPRYVFYDE